MVARSSPRTYLFPSLSPWHWGRRGVTSRGPGPSTVGLKAIGRPSSASPISADSRLSWLGS